MQFQPIADRLVRLAACACWLFLWPLQSVHADVLEVNGQKRTFTLVKPNANKPAPLVMVLHGNTQQGADLMERSSWPELARREGFAVVFPDGLNGSWADGRYPAERAGTVPPTGTDDRAFLLALTDHLMLRGIADPRRVYLAGVSNGGAMALTLACSDPQRFTAVASVIMLMTQGLLDTCTDLQPNPPLPMLFMNGTEDPLVSFTGGQGRAGRAVRGAWSFEETLGFWRSFNGCQDGDARVVQLPNKDTRDASTVTRVESNCPNGTDVLAYRVNGGGHRTPGRSPDARFPKLVDKVLGPQNHDIDGPEEIWAFFQRFSLVR
ncbi:alpha/beta hydrolase-fold protein [Limnobacter humi]|uniref:Alpha/beta hydrolase-fold protein n=1 Tax=Limnobacter humi TaxID=1778671 RepID=A0ABT1WKB6_9BURK|nr:PHB depolymerase family esterase [Limnobacter humi]MCQ8897292.1 alpha/beta hydrolase-fold protein [Limnobacter humi]